MLFLVFCLFVISVLRDFIVVRCTEHTYVLVIIGEV